MFQMNHPKTMHVMYLDNHTKEECIKDDKAKVKKQVFTQCITHLVCPHLENLSWLSKHLILIIQPKP